MFRSAFPTGRWRSANFGLLGPDVRHTESAGKQMTTDAMIVVLGTVAGFCTTFAYVPQLIKIWKQGGRDLSYAMLSLYLFGVCLWLAYGLLIHAQAVVVTNLATAILIALATGLKAWTAKRDVIKETLSSVPTEAAEQRG
jgi:MtN3 and saliva related transmembrane protein